VLVVILAVAAHRLNRISNYPTINKLKK